MTGLKVFIDTNVFLRFYAYSDDTLLELEKLSGLISGGQIQLLTTDQVVDETWRNRDREIGESIKKIEQLAASAQIPRIAEHHSAAKELADAIQNAKKAKSALLVALREELDSGGLKADKLIEALFEDAICFGRSSESIERAKWRREIGNPPGKKDSLGDQINWEILLENVEGGDLHVISRDGDFRTDLVSNEPRLFLRYEWMKRKAGSVFVYNGLSEFTKKHFPDIKVPSDAVRKNAVDKLVKSGSFTQTHDAVAELIELIDSLSESDVVLLFNALIENSQISWIIGDDDVKEFYKMLWLKYFHILDDETEEKLSDISSEIFDIPF